MNSIRLVNWFPTDPKNIIFVKPNECKCLPTTFRAAPIAMLLFFNFANKTAVFYFCFI